MSRVDADLIIAGAGCAGLSALWHILHSAGRDRRILVVDRSFESSDDRTWSFWGPPDAPFADLADRRWDQLLVRFPGSQATHRIGGPSHRAGSGRAYVRVRSRDYATTILDEAARHPNVRMIESPLSDIRDDHDAGAVVTAHGELRAPVVFQSVRLSPNDATAAVRHPLRQHFGGWEVRTERPLFDPDVVTFMDFDTEQHDGTAFFYVLPDAPDRALIEHTVFSLRPQGREFYDRQIARHLDRLGAGSYTIERTEYGAIPMEDRALHQRWGRHVWNLGTVGGMTKPSTGYTFQRIHAQSRHLVSSWATEGTPRALPAPPARYAFADRTLLNILHHHPEHGRPIFEKLFGTSTMDDVLTFLDERSSPLRDAQMMSRLPWKPFVRAALEEVGAGRAAHRRPRRERASTPAPAGVRSALAP
jgi:lycopene beta-cyclase